MTIIVLGRTLKNMTTTFDTTVTLNKGTKLLVTPYGQDAYLLAESTEVEVEFASVQPYNDFLEWLQSDV